MEDNVLRLDVSMDDAQTMDLVDRLADLLHDEGNPGFGEGLSLLELMVELASSAYLENDVDVDRITEAAVHLDDVGVIQKHLNLHLSCKLVSYLLLVE